MHLKKKKRITEQNNNNNSRKQKIVCNLPFIFIHLDTYYIGVRVVKDEI